LKHADNLSSTFQHKSFSAAEGQQIARMTTETLKSIRNNDLFWKNTCHKASMLDIGEPQLPRRLGDMMMVCLEVISMMIRNLFIMKHLI
jgi:hypothetical protein